MLSALFDFCFKPLCFAKPAMQSVAQQPVDNSAAIEKARLNAERSAIAEQKQAGRRSTIVGGALMAAEEQMGRGLLSQQKRMAARESLG